LPSYQSRFSGGSYPRAPEQQHSIRSDRYRYQPRDAVTRQFWPRASKAAAPARAEPQGQGREMAPAASQEKHRKKSDDPGAEGRGNRADDRDHGPR
jgi:hypothetical protein